MLIDTHSHIYDDKFEGKQDDIVQNALENGVEKIICVSSDIQSCQKSIDLANTYSNVYAVIGIHPDAARTFDENIENFLIENAANEKVVAIGEIGLDYHYEPYDSELQKEVFIKQLEIANKVGLPVQIHSRDATKDTIDILNKYKHLLKNGGIVHCFSGSVETLKEIEKLGLKISVGGIITFKNANKTLDVVKYAPLEMLMLETDCPYLAPTPYRGKLNQPAYLPLVLNKIAEIRDISKEELEKIIEKNTSDVFKKIKCK